MDGWMEHQAVKLNHVRTLEAKCGGNTVLTTNEHLKGAQLFSAFCEGSRKKFWNGYS